MFRIAEYCFNQSMGREDTVARGLNAPLKLNIVLVVVPLNTGVASAGGDARVMFVTFSLDALYLISSFRGTCATRGISPTNYVPIVVVGCRKQFCIAAYLRVSDIGRSSRSFVALQWSA
jgi:hypothetical protein